MNLQDAIELGLKQIEVLTGENTFIWEDETYDCHAGTQTVQSVLETGGFNETQQTVLVVRKSLFTDDIYPIDNDKITYKDVVYTVELVSNDASDTFINLVLKK